jgi:hypothetical protein
MPVGSWPAVTYPVVRSRPVTASTVWVVTVPSWFAV